MPAIEVEIPPESLITKADFLTFPGKDVVREIRGWIADGNPSFTWRGHTHTEPPANAPVEYVADFQLPKGRLTPCPCCWPKHEKFRTGRIAWFPDEYVIRLIGPNCFKTLNREGHERALADMRARQQSEADIAFLLSNREFLTPAISIVERALPLAREIDRLQSFFTSAEQRTPMVPDLWPHVRDGGMLKVSELRRTHSQSRSGQGDSRQQEVLVQFASVDGYRMIEPRRKPLEPRLERALRKLLSARFDVDINTLTDGERRETARAMNEGFRSAKDPLDELSDVRRFLSAASLGSIRRWGQTQGSAIGYYINRDGFHLQIGKSSQSVRRIEMDRAIDTALPPLPNLIVPDF